MRLNELLAKEIYNSVFGDPWHGSPVVKVLENINALQALARPIKNAHNIFELLLHVYAWTEEAMQRMDGKTPTDPELGDWPEVKDSSESGWDNINGSFFEATNKLIEKIKSFPAEKFSATVGNLRDASLGTGTSFEEMIHGLAQHNAYHSGQIALIKKIIEN